MFSAVDGRGSRKVKWIHAGEEENFLAQLFCLRETDDPGPGTPFD